MIAELGNLALVTALLAAVVQGACGIFGGARGDAALGRIARRAGYAQLVLVALSFAALTACFVRDDFSVLYVATNSNTALPLIYKFAAVWGAHEGSLLLWALILMAWIGVAARAAGDAADALDRGGEQRRDEREVAELGDHGVPPAAGAVDGAPAGIASFAGIGVDPGSWPRALARATPSSCAFLSESATSGGM